MKEAIDNYTKAVLEHIQASKAETNAKVRKAKARYNLLQAKEALRAEELEFLTN